MTRSCLVSALALLWAPLAVGQAATQNRQPNRDPTVFQKRARPIELKLLQLPLRHVDATEMIRVVEQLGLTEALSIVAAPQSNTLIVRGSGSGLDEFKTLVAELDQPAPATPGTPGPADSIQVKLDAQGRVFIDERQISESPDAIAMARNRSVQVAADPRVNHKSVVELLDRLKQGGAKRVGFTVQDQAADSAGQQDPGFNTELLGGTATNAGAGDQGDSASSLERDPRNAAGVLRAAYESAERQAAKLADQWRREQEKTSPDTRTLQKLESSLEAEIAAAFRLRQQWQWEQLEQHQQELNRLREQLSRRERIAERIIAHRKTELQSQDDLSWLPPTAATKSNSPTPATQWPLASTGPDPTASTTAAAEQPRSGLVEVSGDGTKLTISATSEDHLDAIESAFEQRFGQPLQQVSGSVDHPNDRSLNLWSTNEQIELIASIVKDIESVKKLYESIESASEVPIQLIGPASLTAKWSFTDRSFRLPAQFFLDAGNQLNLDLLNRSVPDYGGAYGSIKIHDLSTRARDYFKTHPLRIGFSLADFQLAGKGWGVSELYFLEDRDGELRLSAYPAREAPLADQDTKMELVAEFHTGNKRAPTSDVFPAQHRRGITSQFETQDSVLFIELIVTPTADDTDQPQKAIYMDGTTVGDEGLVAIIIDELLDEDGKLAYRLDSVTIKTAAGEVIHDALLVAHDAASGLGLLRSPGIPVPALDLDGPHVVASQGVIVLGRSGSPTGATTFEKKGLRFETQIEHPAAFRKEHPSRFLLPFVHGSPGAAVTLATTGQLVGILSQPAATNVAIQHHNGSLVVPVTAVRDLVGEYRDKSFR